VEDPTESADSQEKIFKVALPVSLEAVFQTSLGFVDQIIVGTLGATALAAVGLCNSISFQVLQRLHKRGRRVNYRARFLQHAPENFACIAVVIYHKYPDTGEINGATYFAKVPLPTGSW
jgi:MatE